MRRILFLMLTIVLLSLSLQAQGLYKVKYQANNTTYDGLMVWYGTSQPVMRIRYFDSKMNQTLLVEQNVRYEHNGAGEILRGSNAKYLSQVPAEYKYYPDHFVFEMVSGYYACTSTFDDNNTTGAVLEFRPLYQFEVTDSMLRDYGFNQTGNSGINNNNSNTTLYLIIVADIEDRNIGVGVQVDVKGLESEFQSAAQSAGIQVNKTILTGENFNRTTVVHTLNNLNPSSNDIVLFIYDGHGFRYDDDTDSYPRMALTRGRVSIVGNNLSASEVYNSLKKKHSRLNITLIDACNSKIGMDKPNRDGGVGLKPSDAGISRAAVSKLFVNTRGNLIVAAASKGEYAYTNSRDGGYFVHSFLDAFMSETSVTNTGSPKWESIIQNTRTYAYQNTGGKQTATYYTELR